MFWKRKKGERKERSDKKVHVQPTISVELKVEIERLAYILGQPVKRVGELLFVFGINEREVVEQVAKYFLYGNLIFENTLFIGHEDNPQLEDVPIKGPTERISIRFDKDAHHDVDLYADMLGVSHSRATAFVMEKAIKHIGILEEFLKDCNKRYHFDEVSLAEVKKLMKYVNRKNPYKPTWDQRFMEFLEGPKKKLNNLRKPMTPECIDTETYKWDLDSLD